MNETDYPLSEVPKSARQGLLPMAAVLLGFTFFTATMWAGGTLGKAFSFSELLLVIVVGNLLLGAYTSALAFIAYKSGLNSVLMGRFCFGEVGSKLSDFVLGFTQIGWYAWGTATIAIVLVKVTGISQAWEIPLMIFFGFAFCLTAMIGFRGLDLLSRVAVPAMLLFILISLYTGMVDVGGMGALFGIEAAESMSFTAAITVVIGTFVSGGTQATNWSRFASSGKVAVWATMAAFFIGNGLMVLTGALGTLIYQQADIVDVMLAQGFVVLAVLMLFLNIWTTQDNTIYNFAVAGCNLLRTDKRRTVTVVGAAIGTVLAVFGMYNFLIPFLVLLGTFIPPIGGVIMADFWLRHKGEYPKLSETQLPAFNWLGLGTYVVASACAYFSPFMPPVVGVAVAFVLYGILIKLPLGATAVSATATENG
ncbi:MAG: cytosine permease [Oceanospirillaceae bacterium]|uniref:cytosine permease n=3 Tax=unclassified Thalassolituus TaxID=2624967 RepID=UPI000C689A10|nr:cytosine permease [Thalassolituus sp. UBA1505]MAS25092.1 cytosine permease [Oceanospirillaceae bacterium]MAX99950.1 cytosine permease [Oceanospirillaceae bacterium]MBL36137.1 cytosine permease [Oceanospirillaceae bacterium]MBS53091.1 cytosine permease [Oceanospirillaceae bacterium]|tara:strand:- start:65 stop:1330 length:1266 start_codon:yes stop_codon:yes gene_type:complete